LLQPFYFLYPCSFTYWHSLPFTTIMSQIPRRKTANSTVASPSPSLRIPDDAQSTMSTQSTPINNDGARRRQSKRDEASSSSSNSSLVYIYIYIRSIVGLYSVCPMMVV
jgi:hypothetical protein